MRFREDLRPIVPINKLEKKETFWIRQTSSTKVSSKHSEVLTEGKNSRGRHGLHYIGKWSQD